MSVSRSNLAASVQSRLQNLAKAGGRPVNELLQFYAIERFLYRLSVSRYRDTLILKGALMLLVWGGPMSRPTRDIDLLGRGASTLPDVAEIAQEICTQPVPPDGMQFNPDSVRVETIREEEVYDGVRVRLVGNLGKARLPLQIDIAFGDALVAPPRKVDYPALLDLPAPRVSGYLLESAVAEKIQAILALGYANTRMKDYYDLWQFARSSDQDLAQLRKALKQTLTRRQTAWPSSRPDGLTDEFAHDKETMWQAYLKRTGLEAPSLIEVVKKIWAFVNSLLQS